MKSLKILIATDDYWPNFDGGALFERRLAHGIAELGHDVRIVAAGRRFKNYEEEDPPTKIYRLRSWPFIFNIRYWVSFWPYGQIKKIIKEFKPDIIHVHNPYLIGRACVRYGKKVGIKLVATNHFMPENAYLNFPLGKLFRRWLTKLTWNYLVRFHNTFDFVASPTPTAVEAIEAQGLTVPSGAISNGIETNIFHPDQNASPLYEKYKLPRDEKIILYVGRLDGEKRLDILLEGFAGVLKTVRARLVLAGGGVQRKNLEMQTKQLGISEQISFLGFLPEEEKPHLYRMATVFAITSPAELQSIVTLEAMASGLPVVAVDKGALKELVHDGENGFLIKFEETAALADKLKIILENVALAKKFGAESRKIVEEHHSTEKTFQKYLEIYERLIVPSRSR